MLVRNLSIVCLMLCFASPSFADIRTYDFDDGTFQGWVYVNLDGDPLVIGDGPDDSIGGWMVTDEVIDAGGGEGFDVLQGSSVFGIGEIGNPQREPNPRVVPWPFENRDRTAQSQFLQSPEFMLDTSGPITVDMMGGAAQGGAGFVPTADDVPLDTEDFDFEKSSTGLQGFALYDVAEEEYVRWAFPSFTNDGKERDGREVWETVEIPQEDLMDLAGDGKSYRVDIFDSYSGGWGWIGFDTVRIPDASFTAEPEMPASPCLFRDADGNILDTICGDLDGDLSVGFLDFLILAQNFGQSAGGVEAASTVPEPTSAALAMCAALGLLGLRRRR